MIKLIFVLILLVIVVLINNHHIEKFTQTENMVDVIVNIKDYVKKLNDNLILEINKPVHFTNFEHDKYVKLNPNNVDIKVNTFNIKNDININENNNIILKNENTGIKLHKEEENDICSFNINNNNKLTLTSDNTPQEDDNYSFTCDITLNDDDYTKCLYGCNNNIVNKNKINITNGTFNIKCSNLNIKTKYEDDKTDMVSIPECNRERVRKYKPIRRTKNIVLDTNNLKLNNKNVETFYEGMITGYVVHERNLNTSKEFYPNNDISSSTDTNSNSNVIIPPGWVLCNRYMWVLKSKYYSTKPKTGLVISESPSEFCNENYWEWQNPVNLPGAYTTDDIDNGYNYKLSQNKHCITIGSNSIMLPEAINIDISDAEFAKISQSRKTGVLIGGTVGGAIAAGATFGSIIPVVGTAFGAVIGAFIALSTLEKNDCQAKIPDKVKQFIDFEDNNRLVKPKENDNQEYYSYFYQIIDAIGNSIGANLNPYSENSNFLKYYTFVPNENTSHGFKHETDNIELHSFESGGMDSYKRYFQHSPYIMKY